MVTMVLEASATGCLTLAEIYQHIAAAFPYYRLADKKWQNSIRVLPDPNLAWRTKW